MAMGHRPYSHSPCKRLLRINNCCRVFSYSAITCMALIVDRIALIKNFTIVLLNNAFHILATSVAHFDVVFVENLVVFIIYREVLVNKV